MLALKLSSFFGYSLKWGSIIAFITLIVQYAVLILVNRKMRPASLKVNLFLFVPSTFIGVYGAVAAAWREYSSSIIAAGLWCLSLAAYYLYVLDLLDIVTVKFRNRTIFAAPMEFIATSLEYYAGITIEDSYHNTTKPLSQGSLTPFAYNPFLTAELTYLRDTRFKFADSAHASKDTIEFQTKMKHVPDLTVSNSPKSVPIKRKAKHKRRKVSRNHANADICSDYWQKSRENRSSKLMNQLCYSFKILDDLEIPHETNPDIVVNNSETLAKLKEPAGDNSPEEATSEGDQSASVPSAAGQDTAGSDDGATPDLTPLSAPEPTVSKDQSVPPIITVPDAAVKAEKVEALQDFLTIFCYITFVLNIYEAMVLASYLTNRCLPLDELDQLQGVAFEPLTPVVASTITSNSES